MSDTMLEQSETDRAAGSRFFIPHNNCLPGFDTFKEFSAAFAADNQDILPTGSGLVLHAQTSGTIAQIEPYSSLRNNGSLIDLIYDEANPDDRVWQLSVRLPRGQCLTEFGLPVLPEWNKSPCTYQVRVTKTGAVNGLLLGLDQKGTKLEHTCLGDVQTQQVMGVIMQLSQHKFSQDKIEERRGIRQNALAELSRVCLEQTLPLTHHRVTKYHDVSPHSLNRSITERVNYLSKFAGFLPFRAIPLPDGSTALTTVVVSTV